MLVVTIWFSWCEREYLVSSCNLSIVIFKTRREEQIKAAHDKAMFGASSILPSISTESEPEMEDDKEESNENGPVTSLLSDKVSNFTCFWGER